MKLVGEKVKHKIFGLGTIVEHDDKNVFVNFEEEVKRFVYPDAFQNYLVALDYNVQANVLKEINQRTKKQNNRDKKFLENQSHPRPRPKKPKKKEKIDTINAPYAFTVENLAILGALDDYYEVYKSFCDIYESKELKQTIIDCYEDEYNEIPKRKNRSRPNKISREKVLYRYGVKNYLLPFLKRHHSLFIRSVNIDEDIADLFMWERFLSLPYIRVYISVLEVDRDRPNRPGQYKLPSFKSFSSKNIWVISALFAFWKNGNTAIDISTIQTVYYDICTNLDNRIKTTVRIQDDDNNSIPENNEPLYIFDRLSSTRCWRNHQVLPKKFTAKAVDGTNKIVLPVHYCSDCNRYLIGKRTLSLYEKKFGKLFIQRKKISDYADSFESFSPESYLHQMGYNVIDGELTDEQRQAILIRIIESKRLSYFNVCATIEQNIRLFQGSQRHQLAVYKWKKDLKFIGDYVIKSFD